jgi:ATPase subunit of ABC transporter with duplicated ATPase domains
MDATRPMAEDPKLRALLGRFLFSGDKVFQRVGSLSGGERTRLSLAKLVIRGHNLLLLDEPTTYLDPASQEILITALGEYTGTLIIVSHNTDFVARLKPDTAMIMPEGLSVPYADDLLTLVELA